MWEGDTGPCRGAKSFSQVQMWNGHSLCFWRSLEMSSPFLQLSPTRFTVTFFVCISLSPPTYAYVHAGAQSWKMAWMANKVPLTGCFCCLITDGKSNFSFLGKGQMFAERSSMRRQMLWGEAASSDAIDSWRTQAHDFCADSFIKIDTVHTHQSALMCLGDPPL